MILFAVIFIFALVVEGALSTIPLTFIVLLTFLILKRQMFIFYLAFISGIFLDLMSVREVGITSAYFLTVFLAVLLYESKFETRTLPFVALASFLGSLGFLFLTAFSPNAILPAITATCVSLVLFKIYARSTSLRAGSSARGRAW